MSFTDHKITQFVHRIVDLPDQPNLPADELKARFDSSPEELRQAVNGICDDAGALESRVDGIVEGSFAGAVTEALLAPELAAKLNGAATTAAVTAQVSAETTARTAADASLQDQIDDISAQSCQLYVGSYRGTGTESKTVTLGWKPRVVLIMQYSFLISTSAGTVTGGMFFNNNPLISGSNVGAELTSTGFRVYNRSNLELNTDDMAYYYIALR